MTSRRYSELSNLSNMSLIDEADENTTPVLDANNTPRAKFVPAKKTRISDSPLTSHQQHAHFRGGDRNLEETFVEQPSMLTTPVTTTKLGHETPSTDTSQQSMPFKFDRNLEETYVEQPSVLATPVTAKSGQQDPSPDTTQQEKPFRFVTNLEETYVEQPSVLATPVTANVGPQTPSSDTIQQKMPFRFDTNLEQTYVEQSFVATPSSAATFAHPPSADNTPKSATPESGKNDEHFVVEEAFLDTPSSINTQRNVSFKIDTNLEESRVEQQSFVAPSLADISAHQTPSANNTSKNVSFKDAERHDESGQQSFFTTPANSKSIHKTPATNASQKSVSFKLDNSLDETIIKPSFFATPKPPSKKQPLEYEDISEQENLSFVEESFTQETAATPEAISVRETTITTSSEVITTTSSKRLESDVSVLEASMVSFLEEEMQVYAEEQCKCVRFESIMKEYVVLREKFETVSKPFGAASTNTTFKIDEDEVFRLNEELVKIKMEVEDYKKAADIAKKEAEDFQFVLDEEKRRTKNRISDLQKENFALVDELESLRLGGAAGDVSAGGQQQHQNDDISNELQEELAQIKDRYSKASTEIEEYKVKVEDAQKEVEGIKAGVAAERELWNAHFTELQNQKTTEVESLKAELGDTVTLKTQLAELKERLAIFDAVVQKGYEVEEICKQLKLKNDALVNEKLDLQILCDTKDAEFTQLKDAFDKENIQIQGKLADLNDQLLKASDETEVFKVKSEDLQKEFQEFRHSVDARIAEVQQQKDAEIRSIKTSMGDAAAVKEELVELQSQKDTVAESFKADIEALRSEKAELQKLFDAKNAEIGQLKDAFDKENIQLQGKLADLNDQLFKATDETEVYKVKAADLQIEFQDFRDSVDARIAKVQQQKDAEIESMKASMGDVEAMKKELAELQSQKITVTESFKADIEALRSEKAELQKLLDAKNAEVDQLKETFDKENIQLQGKLADLNDQLLKASDETEVYKVTAADLQIEFQDFRDSVDARISEVQQQKNAEIETMKASMGDVAAMKKELAELQSQKITVTESFKSLRKEKVELQQLCDAKAAEIGQLKDSFDKEKTQLQKQISELTEQQSKAAAENEKLNKKVDKLYDDLDAADSERKELAETVFSLQSKLAKYSGGEDGTEIRAPINMGEAVSPTSPDTSFKSVAEEPEEQNLQSVELFEDENDSSATPSKAKGTPKRKQSFGAKLASPFRRTKKDQPTTTAASTGKEKENQQNSCATQ